MGRDRKLTTAQIAAAMAIFSLGSKLLGFIRETVLANYYGAGMITDAFGMAQGIPGTLLASLLSAVGIAYMPTLSAKVAKDGEEEGDRFTSRLFNSCGLAILVIIAAGILLAGPLVRIFAPGYDPETKALTAYYLRIAFFLLLGILMSYIFDAYLQYRGSMLVPTVAGYLQNVFIIAFILISARTTHRLLIWGVLLGYLARGAASALYARRRGFRYTPAVDYRGAVGEVLRLALPIFIGGFANEINVYIDRMLASGLGTGAVSALNYGKLLVGVISTFTVTIFVTILYPQLNHAFAENDMDRISTLSSRGIDLTFVVAAPFTLGCLMYSLPVVQVIFERGAFDAAASRATATAFFFYTFGLVFTSVTAVLTKIFYSMHDTKTAVYCSAVSVAVNIVLNLLLIRPMGAGGLALATSIAQAVNAILLWAALRRKYPQIRLMRSPKKLLLTLLFSVAAVAASFGVWQLAGLATASRFVRLGAAVLTAAAVYLLALKLARYEELKLIRDLFKR